MDLERYYELRTLLQQWKTRLAESIRRRIEGTPRLLAQLQAAFEQEGAGESFTEWLDGWCRQAGIQFILRILFLRVLEDRGLLGTIRLRTTDGQKMWTQLTRHLGAAHYVQWCCWDAAHLLPDLFGATEYDLVLPDDDLVEQFLQNVWRRPDANRGEDWLRFDFRPDPSRGDEGFETRFIGDLYQELDAEIRERYALLQTPHFVSQFILENTLLKRFEEKDFRQVTLIDPTGGSGHFYVDGFWMFVARYEQAAGKGRGELSVAERARIARTIIEQQLFGCDINPYAVALARFRLILAACDYAQPASLREFRDLRFNLVTIDSLIPYEKLMVGHVQAGSAAARLLGHPDAIARAVPVLRGRYDVVVGNPPYIVARDRTRKSLYAQAYPKSATGKFHLGAPFTERFFQLASENGCVGLINSNAFTKRDFGKSLIEQFLTSVDLEAIVDLSGVHIPHHGTPTLILFGRKRSPVRETLTLVSCLQGAEVLSGDGNGGAAWKSIVANYPTEGYRDAQISIDQPPRIEFTRHPWDLTLDKANLLKRIAQKSGVVLSDLAISEGVGVSLFTLRDEVFVHPPDVFRRAGIDPHYVRTLVIGEAVRDWTVVPSLAVLFPYTVDEENSTPVQIEDLPHLRAFLRPFHNLLAGSHTAETKSKETGWYEFGRLTVDKYLGHRRIGFSAISTHNHFLLDESFGFAVLYKQSAPLVKLLTDSREGYCPVVALLNAPVACLFLKQKCYNKGAGRDPVRDRYDLSGQNVASIPLPKEYENWQLTALTHEMLKCTESLPSLVMAKLFELNKEAYHSWNQTLQNYIAHCCELPQPFTSARDLRAALNQLVALRQDIRGRMIFLQEEMDWLAYEMYGLIKKAPLAEDYLSQADYHAARLELGQRPFEVAGRGYGGDWPAGYQPAPMPESLRPLTEARMALIEANPDITLLEDPLYKRRWVPPDYEQEFREAAAWWLAEKLEWALEQYGQPISLREWARLLSRDERVNAVLEVLTGNQLFDLEDELRKVIRANAAPNRPEHYLKLDGLRKLYAARQSDPPGIPEFKSSEFSDSPAWKLRGKLNIPRERFIYYAEFDPALRGANAPENGGPWFGWAGWDAGQRADALAILLDRAGRAGWEVHWQQCGLRAALRDLLPELVDLPAADLAEFEAIARGCGIGLGIACYCQAYKDGVARGEAGVPGVGAEALGVTVVAAGEAAPRAKGKKSQRETGQLRMDL